MFFAYKYVKRKCQERQAQETSQPQGAPTSSQTQIQATHGFAQNASWQPSAVEADYGNEAPVRTVDSQSGLVPGRHSSPDKQNSNLHKIDQPPISSPKNNGEATKDGEKKEHRTPEEKAAKSRQRKYRYKIIFGLMMPFTLQALDTTIIASALPYIAKDFNQLSQLNWIISAFNLTSASFLPLWAQVADIFGRATTLHTSLIVTIIGSAICTGAPITAFGVLLLGRAIQGVGCAGINICVRTILADKVDLAEYAKNWTIFALFSAVGFSIGPVAGGYLTRVNWRWCFGINLPVGVLAVILGVVLIRGELLGAQELPELGEKTEGQRRLRDKTTKRGRFLLRLATIDYGGQALFLWGFGLLVLGMTWAGKTYAWESAGVVAPLVAGLVLTVGWLVYEYSMAPGRLMARVFPIQRAMMPWKLLEQRDIGLLFVVNFTVGAAMFAVMYFMDIYFALVLGHDPDEAGVALLYFLPGLGAGVYMSMFFTNVWPRQTLPSILLGSVTAAVGITVLAWATYAENVNVIYGMMALTGHGVGMRFNPGALHGLAYFPTMTAQISCLVTFAHPFGGTIALTIMSTVFNNRSGPTAADRKTGIMWAYISMIPIMWLSVLVSILLGNVWILKESESEGVGRGHEVVHGAWLWNLFTGKKLQRVRITQEDGVRQAGVQSSALPLQDLESRERKKPDDLEGVRPL